MEKYRVNEACQVTGLSRKTIYRKMENGQLPYTIENGKRYIKNNDLESIKKTSQQSNKNVLVECASLKDEITALRDEIRRLTTALESLTQLSDSAPSSQVTQKGDSDTLNITKSLSGDNAKRSEEAKKRLFTALDTMDEIPMYRGKPSITGIYRATGIDRGTISKYLNEYMSSK